MNTSKRNPARSHDRSLKGPRRIYHWRIIRTHDGVSNTVTLRRDKDDAERAAKQLQALTQNPNVRYSVEPRD